MNLVSSTATHVAVGGLFNFPHEAAGGTGNSCATNYPIVTFQRGDNVAIRIQPFTIFVPALNPTPSVVLSVKSAPPAVPGWQWVRITYNGVPSVAFPYLVP